MESRFVARIQPAAGGDATAEQPWVDQTEDYGADQPGSVLLARLSILGTYLHLQAIRVTDEPETPDGETIQHAADPALQDDLEKVYALYDYAFETTAIPGFEGAYILYAHPYGD